MYFRLILTAKMILTAMMMIKIEDATDKDLLFYTLIWVRAKPQVYVLFTLFKKPQLFYHTIISLRLKWIIMRINASSLGAITIQIHLKFNTFKGYQDATRFCTAKHFFGLVFEPTGSIRPNFRESTFHITKWQQVIH